MAIFWGKFFVAKLTYFDKKTHYLPSRGRSEGILKDLVTISDKKGSFQSPDFGRFFDIWQGYRLAFLAIFLGKFFAAISTYFDTKSLYIPSRGRSGGILEDLVTISEETREFYNP